MANTFTTNYGLTKSEIGANNDNWGTDLNNALSSVDTQINRKVDKADIVTQTSNKIAFSGSTITANSTTASTIFENFKAGDVISIAGAVTANNGNHTISSKTNAYTLVTSSSFTTEAEGDNTISYHLVPKYSEVDIDGGTIDGATIATSDITVGSGKTLDGAGTFNVSSGTFTTSTAQKDAIVDGSTAITRSTNDIAIAGDLTVTGGDIKSSGGTTAISVSGANTTLAGTANNIGTVTAGTISSGVTLNAIPTNLKLIKIQRRSQTSTGSTSDTNWRVAFDSVSFTGVSGKTYIISVMLPEVQMFNSSSTVAKEVTGWFFLQVGTTNRTNGQSQSSQYSDSVIVNSRYRTTGEQGFSNNIPMHLTGAYAPSSNGTYYTYVAHHCPNLGDSTTIGAQSITYQWIYIYETDVSIST